MSDDPGVLWVDRPWLVGTQYRTDANLAARRSIYAHQRPRHDGNFHIGTHSGCLVCS